MDKDEYFEKMLQFVLAREGGYVNNPADIGGETNKGITHGTYDSYRRSKGLPSQSVKNISDDEVRDIYYNNYYKSSGADKLDNPQLGLYVFDTAVNMGVGTAKSLLKESGENLETFEKLRRNKYQAYANSKESQKQFLKGWNNRVDHVNDYAKNNSPSSRARPFDLAVEMDVDQDGNVMNYYNKDDVNQMTPKDIIKSIPILKDQVLYKMRQKSGVTSNIDNKQIIPSVHFGPQKASERLKGLSLEQLTPKELDELLEELI